MVQICCNAWEESHTQAVACQAHFLFGICQDLV